MKKICVSCHTEKDISEYNKNAHRKEGISRVCKSCNKASLKAYYDKHKKREQEKRYKRKKEIREWFREYKKTLFCKECGENHPATLDFHHRDRTEKEGAIYYFVRNSKSIESIKKEMDKCDVLCANCHRKIHYEE